jgi:hypothetical protein
MTAGRAQVLISAPGGGLGHLVRAAALALRLGERGRTARVVTNSPYAEGLARLAGCAVDRIPSNRWTSALARYVEELGPEVLVLDSFPWGLRGEWTRPPKGARIVYLARRLKLGVYLSALDVEPRPDAPHLERVIVAEPLSAEHRALLDGAGGRVTELAGRIRFPAGRFPTPVPRELAEVLDSGRAWLVVHSGPREEVQALIERARRETSGSAGSRLALIVPRPPAGFDVPAFEYFPAGRLFERAERVFAGAGYNIMSDAAPWAGKLVAQPFKRRYDDQAGRLASDWVPDLDGGPAAVEAIITELDA